MATLHIPYYRSDVPVVKYTENINSGVMVIQPRDKINYIGGDLLTPTSNYFKITDSQNTYSSILCKSSDSDGKRLGSFNLPDNNNSGSYVLSYSNPNDENAKYTWTNIEDIALSKCFTSSNNLNTTSSLNISYDNSAFHFDNNKYVYNLLIDGYIYINSDIDTTNNIVKKNKNIFVLINDSSASDLSSITSENKAINLSLFNKYTVDVTDTTVVKKRLCKFIPDFKTTATSSQTNICLTLITADINKDKKTPTNIQNLSTISDIYCNVMITENLRINKATNVAVQSELP